MKKDLVRLATVCLITALSSPSHASLFINEFHYDNSGVDANEGIEITGIAGTDLTGYSLLLYNGSNGSVYDNIALEGVIENQGQNYGALFFATGLQNGPDGIALTDPDGNVLQFISYEGAFAATEGAAVGQFSVDIGLFEAPDTAPGMSLQLTGPHPDKFEWVVGLASSGLLNTGQGFGSPVPIPAALPLLASSLALVGLFCRRRA